MLGRKTENPCEERSPLEPSFSGQKTESGALNPVFDRNRANLEAEAPHLPSDKKKRTFQEFGKLAVLRIFSTKNGAVTKTGDIGKTFSRMENLFLTTSSISSTGRCWRKAASAGRGHKIAVETPFNDKVCSLDAHNLHPRWDTGAT